MTVKQVKNGYTIDLYINHIRYRETIPALHGKIIENKMRDRETIYRMAITMSEKSYLDKYPNSKILQKAFKSQSDAFTIDQYSSVWFGRTQANWARSTIRDYSQKYNTHIKPNFGGIHLRDFTPSVYHDWAKNQILKGKTINHIRSILNQIFREAYLDDVIDFNPIEKTRRSKVIPKEAEPFTKNEIDKILKALDSPHHEFFKFAIWTGLRTGELIALRWKDVDFAKGVIYVRKNIVRGEEKEPKTKGSIRNIQIHENAINALKEIRQSQYFDEYRVFINPKTKKTYKDADGIRKRIWMPALEVASVEYRCPYTCRHTFASMMLSKGENPMKVAAQMGHVGLKMINDVYGRWIPSHA
jgi:integrase